MTNESVAAMVTGRRKYKTPTTKDAYERGFERGFNKASWQDLPEIGITLWTDSDGKVTVDETNRWDVVQSLAYSAESSDRDFSPFEFTAAEFNRARNSEARWEAFEAGIGDGINANIAERSRAYAV